MMRKCDCLALLMLTGAMTACSPNENETGSRGSGGTVISSIPSYGTGGTGGTGEASSTAVAGSGGAAGSSSVSDPTDSYMAKRIAVAAKAAVAFLWNRDMNSLLQTSFSVNDICLLTGSYSATGTRSLLSANCTGTTSTNIDFTMGLCEHQAYAADESVIFSGELHDQWAATYAGSCSAAQATDETITATGMTVTFKRASTGFQKTFASCAIELNFSDNKTSPPATMSGRVCDISVTVTYSS